MRMSPPPTWRARVTALVLSLAGATAAGAQAAAACPPQPQLPSAEQVQAAQSRPRDRGLLWRLQRDGRTSWLYGTIHLGRPMWVVQGPQVRQALQASDTLALEIDVTDAGAMMQALAAVPKPTPLPSALRERLARRLAAVCLPAQSLAEQHPVMQLTAISMFDARWDGLDAAFGQELLLAAQARQSKLPLVALETPQRQMDALIPREAAVVERMVARALDQLEQGTARRIMARLVLAWERGDLAEIEDYERWCDCIGTPEERELMRRLNDERNPAMAERIDALHRQGKRVFVGVGALHMTGPQGLPRLMRERGFRVERVAF